MNRKGSILNTICIVLIILGFGNIIFASIKLLNLNSYLDVLNKTPEYLKSTSDIAYSKFKIDNGIKFYSIVLFGGQVFCFFSGILFLIKIFSNNYKKTNHS